jgi:hypothetical protein
MTGDEQVFRLTTVSRLAFGFAGLGCAIARLGSAIALYT